MCDGRVPNPLAAMRCVVCFDRWELGEAATVGMHRRIQAIAKGRPAYHGAERRPEWQIDITGAMAEKALAKFLNVYWRGLTSGELAALPGDVGPYQVRSTEHDGGHLIVHESDRDDAVFVLAIVAEAQVELAGWRYAREAKAIGAVRKPGANPEYWVAQNQLEPMDTIPDLIGRH